MIKFYIRHWEYTGNNTILCIGERRDGLFDYTILNNHRIINKVHTGTEVIDIIGKFEFKEYIPQDKFL